MRPSGLEVADVLERYLDRSQSEAKLNSWQWRCLNALRRCRTAALGGHIDECKECGYAKMSYNSCRNRHCPKCQGQNRERWIQMRERELLPVKYFHVVFTLPSELNRLCLEDPKTMYSLLFKTAWSVMQSFAANPNHLGAQIGMIAVLHTWGQNLSLHPHLHCIVPAGGMDEQNTWRICRGRGNYLFPVHQLSSVFRARMLKAIRKHMNVTDKAALEQAYQKNWVVYAKQAFGGPHQVIEYLGRYTHKVAISNARLTRLDEQDQVHFKYKDYKQGGKKKQMPLNAVEFIRRFALHILPRGFVRIRHFGILASSNKYRKLNQIRQMLGQEPIQKLKKGSGFEGYPCPCCQTGTMRILFSFDQRGPPEEYLHLITAPI